MVVQYKNLITLWHEYRISTILAPTYSETLFSKVKLPTICANQNKTAPTLIKINIMRFGTHLSYVFAHLANVIMSLCKSGNAESLRKS